LDLTEDEVVQILKWVEESKFDEFNLEVDDLKLRVSKKGNLSVSHEEKLPASPSDSAEYPATVVGDKEGVAGSKTSEIGSKAQSFIKEGLIPINAPILGTFYRCPEPGAPPYVNVGDIIKEDDTVCLLEVMKTFNAVKAEVSGYIEEIRAESSQLVEYGQILFLVKPDEDLE